MTGKRYYMTTLGDWQRHAARFANSHFIVLDAPAKDSSRRDEVTAPTPSRDGCHLERSEGSLLVHSERKRDSSAQTGPRNDSADGQTLPDDHTEILVLIEADEGVHLSLEDEPAFEALPHPLAQKPISDAAQSALAQHGVAPGATMFDAAEALARIHPLLRHRVF